MSAGCSYACSICSWAWRLKPRLRAWRPHRPPARTRDCGKMSESLILHVVGVEQPGAQGVFDEIGTMAEVEFSHHPHAIRLDGLRAQRQSVADLLAAIALRRQRQHLALALTQPVGMAVHMAVVARLIGMVAAWQFAIVG